MTEYTVNLTVPENQSHRVYTLNMVHQAIIRPTQPQPPSQAYDLTVIPSSWGAQPSAPPGTFPRQQFSTPWPSSSNTQQLVPGVVSSWRPPAEPVGTSEHAPGTRAVNGVGNDTDGGHTRDGEWKVDGIVPAPELPEGSIRGWYFLMALPILIVRWLNLPRFCLL